MKEVINPDVLNAPCYFPLRRVYGVKIGYRKFEFKTDKAARNFHIKYAERSQSIPKKHKNEVYCADQPRIGLTQHKRDIKLAIDMLLGQPKRKYRKKSL
jgi:hypothetical protein